MNLTESTPDWNLPIAHELYWSCAFMRGGRTFIDVGAHVGTWTLRLAPLFERVFCFEPDPRAHEALSKNLELVGLKNVEVIPMAVSDRVGSATLTLYPNPCTNTMMDPEACLRGAEAVHGSLVVPTTTIDAFVRERGITDLDFLKVDAEGAELLIVEGARETLKGQRPDFFVEMHGLFYERLRRLMPWEQCDVVDGGPSGLSLVRHRDAWPEFEAARFGVYPHPRSPTHEEMTASRRRHGIAWQAPTTGFLSEEGEDHAQ